jgi:hypothetical protein
VTVGPGQISRCRCFRHDYLQKDVVPVGPVKSAAAVALDMITYFSLLWGRVKSAAALALDMITYRCLWGPVKSATALALDIITHRTFLFILWVPSNQPPPLL